MVGAEEDGCELAGRFYIEAAVKVHSCSITRRHTPFAISYARPTYRPSYVAIFFAREAPGLRWHAYQTNRP